MNRLQSSIEQTLGYAVAWGDTAAWLALVLAVVGAMLAIFQMMANASLSRENTALEAHRQLLCLCIERPELSSSTLMQAHLRRDGFKGIGKDWTPETERALWFLSYLLNAMEQVFESKPRDPYWRDTIAAQIGYHDELIAEVWCDWEDHYGPAFGAFVRETLSLPLCEKTSGK